jgi:hypothetical protein
VQWVLAQTRQEACDRLETTVMRPSGTRENKQQTNNSMSTGCAVLFGGNIYVFFIFPLGVTTDFCDAFLKASLTPSMFPKNNLFSDIAKIKTNQKNTKNTFMLRKWLQLAG